MLELARGEWIEQRSNCCLVGSPGTGKTHVAMAWAWPPAGGPTGAFATAAALVTVGGAQKQYNSTGCWRNWTGGPVICDELGYLCVQPGGRRTAVPSVRRPLRAEEPAGDEQPAVQRMGPGFQGERMTAALLDRLTHRCHIFEMNGESFRFRESMKAKKGKKAE